MAPTHPNEKDLTLGLDGELIKKSCALAFKAHKSPKKRYILKKIQNSSSKVNIIISFPGSWDASDWFARKPFGVTDINLVLFPSLRSIGNDEVALVNETFLLRFESILSNSSLKSKVNEAITKGYQIVFTGHSSGAVMAILATFWALEEYLNPTKTHNHKPPFCVTFGSPLIGNHIFSHVSRRENWSPYFIHFVMRFDIMPRIFLAPFSSIEHSFSSILQLLNPKSKTSTQDSTRASVISEFYSTVMRNVATVTNHAACNLMGNTNLLVENVLDFIALSPYRPFGTYIFCNENGQLIVIRNSDAILQLMFHTAQPNNLTENSEVAHKSIQDHLVYEAKLQESLEMLNVVYLEQLEDLPLFVDGSNSDIATVNAALCGLELSTGARLCLQAAGEWEKQKSINEGKIDVKKILNKMKEVEEYKAICESEIQNKGYYDAFKMQEELRDFRANVMRLELAGVWDEIIEKLMSYELPDEFEGKKEWVDLGTRFRQLLEPLDVANYYRHGKHYEDGASYMGKGRPKRYRYTQRWLEHAERRPPEPNSASCFLAEVEDICYKTSNSNSSFEDVKERVKRLEAQIKDWSEKGELAKDVFLEGSTLVKWWKALPPHHKQKSCIRNIIKD
ncbi:Protein EDS1L, partial [Mucuna pruriens]